MGIRKVIGKWEGWRKGSVESRRTESFAQLRPVSHSGTLFVLKSGSSRTCRHGRARRGAVMESLGLGRAEAVDGGGLIENCRLRTCWSVLVRENGLKSRHLLPARFHDRNQGRAGSCVLGIRFAAASAASSAPLRMRSAHLTACHTPTPPSPGTALLQQGSTIAMPSAFSRPVCRAPAGALGQDD